jgi:GAF domain-containing protein
MNEHPTIDYQKLYGQAEALLDLNNVDEIAKMANLSAWLIKNFNFHWVGFYRVINEQLVLGPFQGPIACYTIDFGKGVCGAAWETKSIQNVPNVHQFPGHIACSNFSNSELVIPCFKGETVFAVLDIDSTDFDAFSPELENFIEKLSKLI